MRVLGLKWPCPPRFVSELSSPPLLAGRKYHKPSFRLPDSSHSFGSGPKFARPKLVLPRFALPKFAMPKFCIAKVSMAKVCIAKVSTGYPARPEGLEISSRAACFLLV